MTKYSVKIEAGILSLRTFKNKIIIDKLLISRIYRKLKHDFYICLRVFEFIFNSYINCDKIEISINSRCYVYLKFLYSIGFKLEYLDGEKSLNKHTILQLKVNDFQLILS